MFTTPLRRARAIAALALAALLTLAAAAQASTIQLILDGDYAQDRPGTVRVTGLSTTGTWDAALVVRTKPLAEGSGCALDADADIGERVLWGQAAAGWFDTADTVTFQAAGPWLLCAWAQSYDTYDTLGNAATSAVVDVREPNLGLRVTGAGRVQAGHSARYRFRFFAEVPRRLEWDVVRGTRCGHSDLQARALTALAQTGEFDVAGSGTEAVAARFDSPGRYRVCGFLQRSSLDGQAQLVASRSVRVVNPRRRRRLLGVWE
jgi:hypothetical protein